MTREPEKPVRRRRVFYVPGYDPVHPRRYRELYRKEGARQAEISGYEITLRAASGDGPFGWQVNACIDGQAVETQFEVLVWSDIVRQSMSGSIPETYRHLLRTAWTYIATGTLWRLMQLRKGPVIAALYPILVLLLQLLLACLLAAGVGAVVIAFGGPVSNWAGYPSGDGPPLALRVLAIIVGGFAGWSLLGWFKSKDGRFFAYYLIHDYAYSARNNGAYTPELDARIEQFVDQLAGALQDDVDEVLVVGHSSGAHVGVSLLAEVIRGGHMPENGPALGFLSLGQVVPMQSFLPNAADLRGDLRYLSATRALSWVDVSAPGDGCSFALCDPVSVSGVAPHDKIWPLVVSAAFTQTLSAKRLAALRWRFFRLHFQYLCAFDQVGDYDYFRITAGPMTLAARYAGRAASPSRIETVLSKFTSVSM